MHAFRARTHAQFDLSPSHAHSCPDLRRYCAQQAQLEYQARQGHALRRNGSISGYHGNSPNGVEKILTAEQRAKMVERIWREDESLSRSVDSSTASIDDDSERLRQTFAFISGSDDAASTPGCNSPIPFSANHDPQTLASTSSLDELTRNLECLASELGADADSGILEAEDMTSGFSVDDLIADQAEDFPEEFSTVDACAALAANACVSSPSTPSHGFSTAGDQSSIRQNIASSSGADFVHDWDVQLDLLDLQEALSDEGHQSESPIEQIDRWLRDPNASPLPLSSTPDHRSSTASPALPNSPFATHSPLSTDSAVFTDSTPSEGSVSPGQWPVGQGYFCSQPVVPSHLVQSPCDSGDDSDKEDCKKDEYPIPLWEFLLECLHFDCYEHIVRWKNKKEGTFKIVESQTLASMWGMYKRKRDMNFDKMSRAMRYYYSKTILEKGGSGTRLEYKFGAGSNWLDFQPPSDAQPGRFFHPPPLRRGEFQRFIPAEFFFPPMGCMQPFQPPLLCTYRPVVYRHSPY